MTVLRLLTVGADADSVHAVTSQASLETGVTINANAGSMSLLSDDVVDALFAPSVPPAAQPVDVVTAIAGGRAWNGGDIGSKARWLSAVRARVWRILIVVLGYDRRPLDILVPDLLDCVERNIDRQAILVRVTMKLGVRDTFKQALGCVMRQAQSMGPPANTPPYVPPVYGPGAWTVDMIVTDGTASFTTLCDARLIAWPLFPQVQYCRLGHVTQTSPDGRATHRDRSAHWTANPAASYALEDLTEYGVTLAIVNVASSGVTPGHFTGVLAEHVGRYPSTVACFMLQPRMLLPEVDLMLADHWQQRLTLGARPCVCAYRPQGVGFPDAWNALMQVQGQVIPSG
jgi:hypothetical protein